MALARAEHPAPQKVRKRLLSTALRALAQLRIELEAHEAKDEAPPEVWFKKFKIAADQIRRDLPDQAETKGQEVEGTKGTPLHGLKIVG